jgi:hypothetical protein
VGTNFEKAIFVTQKILDGDIKNGRIPELWDGKSSERITKIIVKYLNDSAL